MERNRFRVLLTQETGAAVVRDPVHPGLEDEKAEALEEALDRAAGLRIGEAGSVPSM
jgi:hypothetical protein